MSAEAGSTAHGSREIFRIETLGKPVNGTGTMAAPRVVLVDTDHWDAFEWLAPAIRRRGLDVARVVPESVDRRRGVRTLRDRAVFGRPAGSLPDPLSESARQKVEALLASPTVDVQGPEDIVEVLRSQVAWSASPAAQRTPLAALVPAMFDKWLMQEFAEGLGLTVPDAWQQLSAGRFPIVVKGRRGSGGQQVRLARERAELSEAIAELDPHDEGKIFFQAYEPGPILNFGGVIESGRILAGTCYRATPAPDQPLGPPEFVEVVADEGAQRQVAALVEALDYTGFVCLDYVTRPDGSAALIDFNPRVFGSWLALQLSGVDLLGAYLSLFGLAETPERAMSPASVGRRERTRHAPRTELGSWPEWRGEARDAARLMRSSHPITGPRYAVVSGARNAARLAIGATSVRAAYRPS